MEKFYVNCHRDRYLKKKLKSIRKMKNQGSNEINTTYIAQMVMSENPDGSYIVHYTSTHCDPRCNIDHLTLT